MPANRDQTGKFIAGVSGNPSGRPKIPAEVKEILQAACPDAARELVKFIHHKRPNIAMWAITEILNRVYGKPETMSKIELTGSNDGALVFRWATDEKGGNVEARSEDFQI